MDASLNYHLNLNNERRNPADAVPPRVSVFPVSGNVIIAAQRAQTSRELKKDDVTRNYLQYSAIETALRQSLVKKLAFVLIIPSSGASSECRCHFAD